jgi:hypothetical protein
LDESIGEHFGISRRIPWRSTIRVDIQPLCKTGRGGDSDRFESNRIGGVEGRGTQGINLTGGVLEALGIPAREDYLGPFCPCTTCRFESDASATTDHNNGLPKELQFTVYWRGDSHGAHRSSD